MALSVQVCIDCHDPESLSEFWCTALDYVRQPPPAGFDSWDAFADSAGIPVEQRHDFGAAIDPAGQGPRLFFHRVPEDKVVKNRVHLDIDAWTPAQPPERRKDLVHERVERCVKAGATVLHELEEASSYWIVMADPEGNEFCVH